MMMLFRSAADTASTSFSFPSQQRVNMASSWHPAFMPNSAADIIYNEPVQPSDHMAPPTSSEALDLNPVPPPAPAELHSQSVIENNSIEPAPVESDNGHAELDSLRDALTTSLASPGGVELDENPSYDGGEFHAEEVQEEKADFPSEGPASFNKHLSTMSFARTVSEDVNWGEEDEVDPEWNLQRTDTDPFKLMAASNRTNSFPAVPPAHNPAINFEPSHNQAEEIMSEVEQNPKDLFGEEDGGDDDFFNQKPNPWVEPTSHFEFSVHGNISETVDFGLLGGDVLQAGDQDSDARYEEGLPLVQPEEFPASTPTSNPPAFMDDGVDEGDDFFNQVSKSEEPPSEPFHEPFHLERKSTTQVMNSLHFEPHEQTHVDIFEEDNTIMGSSQSSLDKATGGGIASSKSTILSQVLGDPNSSVHDEDGGSVVEPESTEADLAAKWKAALDGDEFLDDEDGR